MGHIGRDIRFAAWHRLTVVYVWDYPTAAGLAYGRYEPEPNYICQRVLRCNEGNYYLLIGSGSGASFSIWNYFLCEREVLIPITQEALTLWSEANLFGEEYGRAIDEFKCAPELFEHETIWQYEHGNIYEFLLRIADDLYMLCSTDWHYPYPCFYAPFTESGKDVSCRDDLYFYYISPEVACLWAESRGMDERALHMAFGQRVS